MLRLLTSVCYGGLIGFVILQGVRMIFGRTPDEAILFARAGRRGLGRLNLRQ